MFEIIILIIVIVCMIYIFKGDFFKRKVVVTVVENLPLVIFKKSNKEEHKKNYEKDIELINESMNVHNEESSSIDEVIEEKSYIEIDKETEEVSKVDNDALEEANNDYMEKIILEEYEENTYCEVACDRIYEENEKEDDISIKDDVKVVEELVYWTPKGKTYHVKNTCRTLSRSKVINSGSVFESGKDFKCEHCK